MNQAKLQALKDTAEQRCNELYSQLTDLNTELERSRGEFRAYTALLENWENDIPEEDKHLKKEKKHEPTE